MKDVVHKGTVSKVALSAAIAMVVVGINCSNSAAQFFGDADGCDGDTIDPSFACGDSAFAQGGGTAIGSGASGSYGGVALGHGANADAYNGGGDGYSVSIGNFAGASGVGSIAIGSRNDLMETTTASGIGAIAVGTSAEASGYAGVAIGRNTSAYGDSGVAIGNSAQAGYDGSVALGNGTTTDRNMQIKLGTASHTYTMTGIATTNSRNQQSGTVYMLTSDANGNLATSTFDLTTLQNLPDQFVTLQASVTNVQNTVNTTVLPTLTDHEGRIEAAENKNADQDNRLTGVEQVNVQQQYRLDTHANQILDLDGRVTTNTQNIALLDNRVSGLEAGFKDLRGQVSANQKEARGGTALALAAAGLHYDDNPGKLSIAGGIGHFKGLTGLSFGMGYATSNSLRFNAGISGVPQNGDIGFNAGASWTLN